MMNLLDMYFLTLNYFSSLDDPDEEVRERGFYHISMLNEPNS